jgi:hypothetical protein
MNVTWNSQLSLRNYNTCIFFIPSEVTVELENTIVDHESCHNSLLLPSYSI